MMAAILVYTNQCIAKAICQRMNDLRFHSNFRRKTDRDTIDAVLEYTSGIAKSYDVPFEEMLFGGTEKQIVEGGTDWCADMARVCCLILKCLNIPCRILHIVDLNKAYNGHVVCERFMKMPMA